MQSHVRGQAERCEDSHQRVGVTVDDDHDEDPEQDHAVAQRGEPGGPEERTPRRQTLEQEGQGYQGQPAGQDPNVEAQLSRAERKGGREQNREGDPQARAHQPRRDSSQRR